ncbi:MAG: endo-1,4-beta-xylanase, partial [Candidatus Bathyarchaeia archaeon]
MSQPRIISRRGFVKYAAGVVLAAAGVGYCLETTLAESLIVNTLPRTEVGIRTPSPMPQAAASTVKIVGQVRSEDGYGIKSALTVYTKSLEIIVAAETDDRGSYEVQVPDLDYYVIDVSPIGSSVTKFGMKFLDHMQTRKLIKRESSTVVTDVEVRHCGNLWLKAYDTQRRRILLGELGELTNQEIGAFPISTQVYDRSRGYLRRGIAGNKEWAESEPALQVPVNQLMKIAAVWVVPRVGKLIFEADNDGEGFKLSHKEVEPINLVFEFAKTEYERTRTQYERKRLEGYTLSENTTAQLQSAKEHLESAKQLHVSDDGAGCASESYETLSSSILAREQMAMEVAKQDIEKNRMGDLTTTLKDQDGRILSNRPVKVRQISHDFLFSVGTAYGSDMVPAMKLLRDLAAEVCMIYYPMNSIQPSEGVYRFEDLDKTVGELSRLGYQLVYHNLVWFSSPWKTVPEYYHSLDLNGLVQKVQEYTDKTVSRISDKVIVWHIVNEAGEWYGNALELDRHAMLKIVGAAFKAARVAKPDGVFCAQVANTYGELRDRVQDGYTVNPEQFFDSLDSESVGYDAIALQWWQGSLKQGVDFGRWSTLLDYYSLRGKKIYLTEGAYPNFENRPDLTPSKWWHEGYDSQTQADWLRHQFTIAFSKPYVAAVGWYEAKDTSTHQDDQTRSGRG